MEKKFIWYGLNKQFNDIVHSHAMTTTDLLNGNYPSWMALQNRGENGNCDFLAECFFTGLKDKKGKEIYEGDIVMHGISKTKSKVEFIGGSFALNNEKTMHNTCIRHYGLDECEVIGSIYKNPELLSTPTAVL